MPQLAAMSGDEEDLEYEVVAGALGLLKPFRASALRSLVSEVGARHAEMA